MLGSTRYCGNNGTTSQHKVLSGGVRKAYFQRLRPKANRLRHGTGSIKYLNFLHLDLIEKEILRIQTFGCRLLDVLTKPFRKSLRQEAANQVIENFTKNHRAFAQYFTEQQEVAKKTSTDNAEPIIHSLSPFATKLAQTASGCSFTSTPTSGIFTFGSTASWERNTITIPELRPVHVQRSTQISTPATTRKQQCVSTRLPTSLATASTVQQLNVNQIAPINTVQPTNNPGAPAKVHTTARPALQTSHPTVKVTGIENNCGAPHCADAHWHEPLTIKNLFEALQARTGSFAATNPLTQSIHARQAKATSNKRTYIDYDKDSQYFGQFPYPKRLRYSDVEEGTSKIKPAENGIFNDDSPTNCNHQSRSIVSYKHTELHVEVVPPDFTKHEKHTFGVALAHLHNDTYVGDGEYPHEFENRGGLPLRGRAPFYTFPLLPPGETYSGWQRPGRDRVILDGNYSYANVITHDNSVDGGFRLVH